MGQGYGIKLYYIPSHELYILLIIPFSDGVTICKH